MAGLWLIVSAGAVQGHADEPPQPHDLWPGWQLWNTEAWLLAGFALAAVLYGAGLRRLWRQAGVGHGVGRSQALAYASGLALLFVALISPLDALGDALGTAHMAQHMAIMTAAPLLLLGAPLVVWLWALPSGAARRNAGAVKHSWLGRFWRGLRTPLPAWGLYALALWAWHAPVLYQLALENRLVHDLEHASFLASSLLFWWVVLRAASRPVALLMIFTTMVHCGLLGVLMSFSARLWYPAYAETTLAWGLTPLQDQQLAGLVMLIPGELGYLSACLGLLGLWLGRLDARSPGRSLSCG